MCPLTLSAACRQAQCHIAAADCSHISIACSCDAPAADPLTPSAANALTAARVVRVLLTWPADRGHIPRPGGPPTWLARARLKYPATAS
eukprot:356139-Chlamydomonas_euryale.AAC.10